MSDTDQPEDLRWRYHRDTKGKCSKWVARDRLGWTHWVTKWDKDKLCVVFFAALRTDWKVQEPSAARDAVDRMVRRSMPCSASLPRIEEPTRDDSSSVTAGAFADSRKHENGEPPQRFPASPC